MSGMTAPGSCTVVFAVGCSAGATEQFNRTDFTEHLKGHFSWMPTHTELVFAAPMGGGNSFVIEKKGEFFLFFSWLSESQELENFNVFHVSTRSAAKNYEFEAVISKAGHEQRKLTVVHPVASVHECMETFTREFPASTLRLNYTTEVFPFLHVETRMELRYIIKIREKEAK